MEMMENPNGFHEILLTVQLVLQRHVLVLQVRQLLRLLQPLLYGWPELPLNW